jgi:hypothetical protein
MRGLWPLLGLCACGGESSRSVEYAHYRPSVAADSWCRLGPGAFGLMPHPQVAPPLFGYGCRASRREPAPANAPDGSTFAELVVEPGGSVEIPVQLPKALQGAGCRIDSVLIPHGKRVSDLAIEIAIAGRMQPIVSYGQLPPPPDEGTSHRTVVSDGSGLRRAAWGPDVPPEKRSSTLIADPELWPTGAMLRFDGGKTADGAPSVVFEIEPEPAEPEEPEQPEEPEEPGKETPSGASPAGKQPSAPVPFGPRLPSSSSAADSQAEPSPPAANPQTASPQTAKPPTGPWPPVPDSQSEPSPSEGDSPTPAVRKLPHLTLVAYRHLIDIAAPDSFSIVLRAREKAFGIGVRSDRESSDPRLSYRAPGAAEPTPTHLVPQVGIVVSRCRRPVEDVLRDIR